MTTEERLHLNTPDPSIAVLSQNDVLEIDDALASNKDLNFAVGLTIIVETNTLRDSCALTGCEREGSTTNGGTVIAIAS